MVTQNSDELMHYGVPGMKWGYRRAEKIRAKGDGRMAKSEKKQAKANRQNASYITQIGKDFSRNNADKAFRLSRKATKNYRKADRIEKRLDKIVSTKANLDAKKVANIMAKDVNRGTNEKTKRAIEKLTKTYSGTKFSDVLTDKIRTSEGKTYCHVLMGYSHVSPYDGTKLYRAEAGTWSKY